MSSSSLHLYYFPTSFYSQKVLIALKEKKLHYKETLVNLLIGEQNAPWYLKLNPKGLVPMLKVGDQTVTDSENIVQVIDDIVDGKGPRLIPDINTEQGRLVDDWRKKIDSIPAEDITFGIFMNKELHTPYMQVPKVYLKTRDEYVANQRALIAKLESLKTSNPEVVEGLNNKIAAATKRTDPDHLNLKSVEKQLELCGTIFDEIELQLNKMKAGNPSECWLCGPKFSAADINLLVMMGRLEMVGCLQKYLDPQKRPALIEYWQTAKKRPTVGGVILNASNYVKKLMVKSYLPKLLGGTLIAGTVVLLGVFIAKKYVKT